MSDELDALYGLPLDEFTAARNELAKSQPEAKALKKPSRAAWTVNQLARTRRDDVDALIQAGHGLRKAQAEGGDFAAATKREREALRVLLDAARGLGATSNAVLDRVRDTLQAAAADEDAAARVLEGRLEHELEAPGFGPLLAAAAAAPRRPPKPPDRKQQEQEKRRRAELEAAVRDAERAEAAARREWEKARAALERAREAAG